MTVPYDIAKLTALDTDAAVQERVADLIGRAVRRQVWFLFVDEGGAQLPLLLPIEDHPPLPDDDDPDRFAALLDHMAEVSPARGVVVVLERVAGPTLSPGDLAWAGALRDAAAASALDLRGILVSHTRGVRWVAPDDYGFGA